MEGFDIESYLLASTVKSGVTLKVSESSVLMAVASQLGASKRKPDAA
jgi:hypothetical protein